MDAMCSRNANALESILSQCGQDLALARFPCMSQKCFAMFVLSTVSPHPGSGHTRYFLRLSNCTCLTSLPVDEIFSGSATASCDNEDVTGSITIPQKSQVTPSPQLFSRISGWETREYVHWAHLLRHTVVSWLFFVLQTDKSKGAEVLV